MSGVCHGRGDKGEVDVRFAKIRPCTVLRWWSQCLFIDADNRYGRVYLLYLIDAPLYTIPIREVLLIMRKRPAE